MTALPALTTSISMVASLSIFLTRFSRQFRPYLSITFVATLTTVFSIILSISHKSRISMARVFIIPTP